MYAIVVQTKEGVQYLIYAKYISNWFWFWYVAKWLIFYFFYFFWVSWGGKGQGISKDCEKLPLSMSLSILLLFADNLNLFIALIVCKCVFVALATFDQVRLFCWLLLRLCSKSRTEMLPHGFVGHPKKARTNAFYMFFFSEIWTTPLREMGWLTKLVFQVGLLNHSVNGSFFFFFWFFMT